MFLWREQEDPYQGLDFFSTLQGIFQKLIQCHFPTKSSALGIQTFPLSGSEIKILVSELVVENRVPRSGSQH